jgi:hypothetical protein
VVSIEQDIADLTSNALAAKAEELLSTIEEREWDPCILSLAYLPHSCLMYFLLTDNRNRLVALSPLSHQAHEYLVMSIEGESEPTVEEVLAWARAQAWDYLGHHVIMHMDAYTWEAPNHEDNDN